MPRATHPARFAALVALAACGFPQPPHVGGGDRDAGSDAGSDAGPHVGPTDLLAFRFPSSLNPTLVHDATARFTADSGVAIEMVEVTDLVPVFTTGGSATVTWNGSAVTSGTTQVHVRGANTIEVSAPDAPTRTYSLDVKARAYPLTPITTMQAEQAIGIALTPGHVALGLGSGGAVGTVYSITGSAATLPSSGRADALAALDYDGDPVLDFVALVGGELVAFQGSDGTTYTPQRAPIVGGPFSGMATGNLDEQGHDDVVLAAPAGVVIERNEGFNGGQATWSALTQSLGSSGRTTVAVATGDVDGDGRIDVIGAYDVPGGSGGVAWLRNLGGGVFDPPVACETDTDAILALAVGAFHGDGRLDAAVLTQAHHVVIVQLAAASGCAPKTVAAPEDATTLAAADLDGDGWSDLVIPTTPSHNVHFYLAQGADDPGSLQLQDLAGPQQGLPLAFVAAGDLDGDGVPDFAATGSDGNLEYGLATTTALAP